MMGEKKPTYPVKPLPKVPKMPMPHCPPKPPKYHKPMPHCPPKPPKYHMPMPQPCWPQPNPCDMSYPWHGSYYQPVTMDPGMMQHMYQQMRAYHHMERRMMEKYMYDCGCPVDICNESSSVGWEPRV